MLLISTMSTTNTLAVIFVISAAAYPSNPTVKIYCCIVILKEINEDE